MLVASGAKPAKPKFELTEHRFEATTSSGDVSALLMHPVGADCLLVLGHSAGAGMRHPFMEALAACLADRRSSPRSPRSGTSSLTQSTDVDAPIINPFC